MSTKESGELSIFPEEVPEEKEQTAVIFYNKGVITIQNFKSDIPLRKMISRMYFLTKSMFEDLIASPKEKEVLQNVIERDKQVGKFYLAIIMHQRALLTQKWGKEFSFVEIMDLRLFIERISSTAL